MGNYPVSYPHPDIYNTQYCILVAIVVSQKILNEAGSYIVQKNRHRQKHIQTTNTAYTINNNNNIEPQLDTNQNNDDDTLVILAKHTTLTEAQKVYLKKD